MATNPDGLNINKGVGSTHPEALAKFVVEKIKKEDKVIMQGELDTRMEVVVKWMKGFMY